MKKNKKYLFHLVSLVLILAIAVSVQASDIPAGALVRVNDEFVYEDAFNRYVDRQVTSYFNSYGIDLTTEQNIPLLMNFKEQILENMIGNEVLRQAAIDLGLVITEEEVQSELNLIKANYPDEDSFLAVLKKVNYTLEDLCLDIVYQKSFDKISDFLSEDKIISEDEMRAYYQANLNRFSQPEQIKASHILVNTEEEINRLVEKIKNGANFATLASEYSECPSSARGGDLGFFSRGQMVPEFEYVAFKTEVGKLSDPVKTDYGWHVILVTDSQEAIIHNFDDVKKEILETILLKNKSEMAINYLRDKWEKADIEYFVEFIFEE